MIRIVILGGTGDVYLLSALFEAFQRHHGREAELVIRSRYDCIPEMFGPAIRFVRDDALIDRAEQDVTLQRDYENDFIDGREFYAHPTFWRTHMRVDHLTTKPDVSQADMYKIILRLPPNIPLALPTVPAADMVPGRVIVIPEARSWPNLYPDFWDLLVRKLSLAGWNAQSNAHSGWTLRDLLQNCGKAEWVIGPQCGVMSILTTGRFPCRKTFATPDVDGRWLFSQRTFPYAYVTKFSNQDYDVEEFKITDANKYELVDVIVGGANGLRLWPHDPAPTFTFSMPVTPGELLDRFAVLTVKRTRLSGPQRAAIEREYQRLYEASHAVFANHEAMALFAELVALHDHAFMLLEKLVPAALADALTDPADHVAAIKANKARIEIKRKIDAALRSPYYEVKSYHEG